MYGNLEEKKTRRRRTGGAGTDQLDWLDLTPSIHQKCQSCQIPTNEHLVELMAQALRRAQAAGVMVQACEAAGDRDGQVHWLLLQARHVMIGLAALGLRPAEEVGP